MSSYEELMNSMTPSERKDYNAEYRDLLISELVVATMLEKGAHIQDLAQTVGLPQAVVKEVTMNNKRGVSLQAFLRLIEQLHYGFILEKNGTQIFVTEEVLHGN